MSWKINTSAVSCYHGSRSPTGVKVRKPFCQIDGILHRNFNLFHHQVQPASTWNSWRTAWLHHTWREDTSPNSQLQLIKDRSQPSCCIQYCEQLKVTKECFLIILICLRIGVPCFLAGFGLGSTTLVFATRQAGWWLYVLSNPIILIYLKISTHELFW